MEERYVVKLERPEGISRSEMKNYIREAVACWGGQYHPDHPLFSRNWANDRVTVVRQKT